LFAGDTKTSVTLYAVWVEKSYTVSYNMNGGVPATITAKSSVHWDDAGVPPGELEKFYSAR
jgi:hypothetical protein